MSASGSRTETLRQLRATRKSMMSARWLLAVEKEDPATRSEAAKELLRVSHAIVRLENAQLDDIREGLLENEAALAEGTQSLEAALKDLSQVKSVLSAATSVLAIVGKVVGVLT